jgi:hypothetical protein
LCGLKKAGIDEGDSTLFLFFFTSLSPVVSGETLLKGAIYFDPRETLEKIVGSKNNADIQQLINSGHVSHPGTIPREVVVTLTGDDPESFAEFYFCHSRPEETYWTLAKFIVAYSLPRNWRHKILNANELYEELFYRSPR